MRGGYYRMHRGWMENPIFEAEPFCRRAAWAWLVENAAWEDTQVFVNGKQIEIKRGQLCHSIRHMAEAWGWSIAAVQRYLKRLTTGTLTDTATDTGRLIVTICDYDVFQAGATTTDTAPDTATDTKYKKVKKEEDI